MKHLRTVALLLMIAFSGFVIAQDTSARWPDNTAAADVQAEQLQGKVYPNPTNGVFTVEIKNSEAPLVIRIIDILGQVVKEDVFNEWSNNKLNKTYDLTDMDQGIYFVEISSENKRMVKKLTVN